MVFVDMPLVYQAQILKKRCRKIETVNIISSTLFEIEDVSDCSLAGTVMTHYALKRRDLFIYNNKYYTPDNMKNESSFIQKVEDYTSSIRNELPQKNTISSARNFAYELIDTQQQIPRDMNHLQYDKELLFLDENNLPDIKTWVSDNKANMEQQLHKKIDLSRYKNHNGNLLIEDVPPVICIKTSHKNNFTIQYQDFKTGYQGDYIYVLPIHNMSNIHDFIKQLNEIQKKYNQNESSVAFSDNTEVTGKENMYHTKEQILQMMKSSLTGLRSNMTTHYFLNKLKDHEGLGRILSSEPIPEDIESAKKWLHDIYQFTKHYVAFRQLNEIGGLYINAVSDAILDYENNVALNNTRYIRGI